MRTAPIVTSGSTANWAARAPLGPGAGRFHPGARPAVHGLPAGGLRALPRRLRQRLPLAIMLLVPRGILPSLQDRIQARRRTSQTARATPRMSGARPGSWSRDPAAGSRGDGQALRRGGGGRRTARIAVSEGTITALIGPNGSGKTTLFNMVTGYLPADAGTVLASPARASGRADPATAPGSAAPSSRRVFGALTLVENLVAAIHQPWHALFRARVRAGDARRARETLELFGLARLGDHQAAELSFGQRKLLEFAAVLMGRPPPGAARRAHLGRQSGDGRGHRAPRARAAPPGADVPDRRARHEPRHAPLRSGDRPRPRRQDRRGGSPPRSAPTRASSTPTWGPDRALDPGTRGGLRTGGHPAGRDLELEAGDDHLAWWGPTAPASPPRAARGERPAAPAAGRDPARRSAAHGPLPAPGAGGGPRIGTCPRSAASSR